MRHQKAHSIDTVSVLVLLFRRTVTVQPASDVVDETPEESTELRLAAFTLQERASEGMQPVLILIVDVVGHFFAAAFFAALSFSSCALINSGSFFRNGSVGFHS